MAVNQIFRGTYQIIDNPQVIQLKLTAYILPLWFLFKEKLSIILLLITGHSVAYV